jgi:hypothetical protein
MRILLFSASALALASTCSAMAAGAICGEHDEIVADLENGHDETAQSIGISSEGNLLEIFASTEGTWTALFTTPAGVSCVVGSGDAWEQVAKPWVAAQMTSQSSPQGA